MNQSALNVSQDLLQIAKVSKNIRIEPIHSFSFVYKHFVIKTVESTIERDQAMALRHKVFKNEMCDQPGDGFDFDLFDQYADILIIKDTKIDRVIGTYRLISSETTDQFYSRSEFNIDNFIHSKEKKLELTRACIDKKYRNGIVLGLLWKGITSYAKLANAKYLFGCSSVWTCETKIAKGIYNDLFERGLMGADFDISPVSGYKIVDFKSCEGAPSEEVSRHMPSLLRAYLKAGARIYGQPAFDKDFKCMDFFTILDLQKVAESYRKYV